MREEKNDFMLFKDAKAELKKHGISIHILEPLIDVIKIFDDLHLPLTFLSEFSDINEYRDLVKNKNNELKDLESRIQDLKHILDIYEKKIASNRIIVQSLNKLENLGFNASDIKNLERVFSGISERYGLNKEEIKILFFRYINCFNTLLSLQQDILEKTDKLSILDSQMAFSIFKTDLCNNMPYGDRTYLERLSKDLNKYRTVRDTLQGLNTKILTKKICIDKLAEVKSKLETIIFSLVVTIIFTTLLF